MIDYETRVPHTYFREMRDGDADWPSQVIPINILPNLNILITEIAKLPQVCCN